MNGFLCDVLWSDPVNDEDLTAATDNFSPNLQRGCSYKFGSQALRQFLSVNKCTALIRAHEVQQVCCYYYYYVHLTDSLRILLKYMTGRL